MSRNTMDSDTINGSLLFQMFIIYYLWMNLAYVPELTDDH